MSISDFDNKPMTFNLNGKDYKIKRLAPTEFLGLAETKVKEKIMAEIKELASAFTGKEKIDYMLQAQKSIPKKDELNALAIEWLDSNDGMIELLKIIFNKVEPVSNDEIANIIMNCDEAVLGQLTKYAIGVPDGEIKPDSVEDKKK